jgi:hypothetical protein
MGRVRAAMGAVTRLIAVAMLVQLGWAAEVPVVAAVFGLAAHAAAAADTRAVNNDRPPTVKVVSVRRIYLAESVMNQ